MLIKFISVLKNLFYKPTSDFTIADADTAQAEVEKIVEEIKQISEEKIVTPKKKTVVKKPVTDAPKKPRARKTKTTKE